MATAIIAVDVVRREEARTNPLLKKTRCIFLKNEATLTKKQREKKEELNIADLNLKSMEALRMRETFQQLYGSSSHEQFTDNLQNWVDWVKKLRTCFHGKSGADGHRPLERRCALDEITAE